MVIKNPPKISPGLIFGGGGGGLIIGMIFVLRIRGAYFRGGGGAYYRPCPPPPPRIFPTFIYFLYDYDHQSVLSHSRLFLNNVFVYVFKPSQKMTFPPSLHPNSFSFPSFDLNIFFLQYNQSSSLVLSVESAISKRLEGLEFVNFLGAVRPPWGVHSAPRPPAASLGRCAASPTALRAVHVHTCTPPPPHSLRPCFIIELLCAQGYLFDLL